MSKGRRSRHRPQPAQHARPAARTNPAIPAGDGQPDLDQARKELESIATPSELEVAAEQSPPEGTDKEATIEEAYRILKAATAAKERLDRELAELDARGEEVESKRQRVEADRSQLDEDRDRFASDLQLLEKERADLIDLRAQREAGYVVRLQERRAEFEGQLDELMSGLAQQTGEVGASKTRLELEYQMREQQLEDAWRQHSQDLEKEFRQRNEALAELEVKTRTEAAALLRQQLSIRAREMNLAEDISTLEELVKNRAMAEIAQRDSELEALRRCCTALQEDLARARESERRLGDRTAEDLVFEISELHEQQRRLKNELATKLDQDAAQNLRQLEREKESWQTERAALVQENGELRTRMDRAAIAVVELETLRDQKSALESSRDVLLRTLQELRTTVDEARASEQETPFPACGRMDQDSNLNTEIPLTENIQLKSFSAYIRHRMAEKGLYYTERDVRSFLAGLAMSRLHLLQGISGTGKTSLPQAFAHAIGAVCATIEVQAGWRERHDLIGHYNSFDKRFYETEFLKALYEANLPFCRSRPFIVLLDEMNLSHPEQYFADFISVLELPDPDARRIALLGEEVAAPALMLVSNGTYLPLPRNVWFIGTANHDETTKDFADKTYDRSHVMELPRHHQSFQPKQQDPADPVALAALEQAFSKALDKHHQSALGAAEWLDRHFTDVLAERFRIGWSNRLTRQIEDYVPVVVESGGSVGEAMDQLVAMKLLRKLRDRHDNRLEDLAELSRRVEEAFDLLDPKWGTSCRADPAQSRCLQLLLEERRRLSPTGSID